MPTAEATLEPVVRPVHPRVGWIRDVALYAWDEIKILAPDGTWHTLRAILCPADVEHCRRAIGGGRFRIKRARDEKVPTGATR